MNDTRDALRNAIRDEARRRGWGAAELAERCRGLPTAGHVAAYLAGQGQMTSGKLCRLFAVLGISIVRPVPTFEPFSEQELYGD